MGNYSNTQTPSTVKPENQEGKHTENLPQKSPEKVGNELRKSAGTAHSVHTPGRLVRPRLVSVDRKPFPLQALPYVLQVE